MNGGGVKGLFGESRCFRVWVEIKKKIATQGSKMESHVECGEQGVVVQDRKRRCGWTNDRFRHSLGSVHSPGQEAGWTEALAAWLHSPCGGGPWLCWHALPEVYLPPARA